jgi:signal transduction histidine kinase
MATLIDDLLSLARAGQQTSTLEAVDVRGLVERCLRNLEGDTDAVTVRVTIEADRRVLADPTRLSQLFENLLGNAADHAGPDATVTVGWLENGDGFYVADDGPGIPPEERETVFDRGYTTAEGGTGFGLNIVEQVVEAHGWGIRVTESDAGGARFEITDVERP